MVALRALGLADAADLLELRHRNRRYFEPTEPLREHDWFALQRQRSEVEAEADERAAGRSLCFGVFADDALVGRVALTSIARGAFQNAYLGYGMRAPQSRGLSPGTAL